MLLVLLEAFVVALIAGSQRGISASQSLLRSLLGQRVNVMILEKALTLQLADFEERVPAAAELLVAQYPPGDLVVGVFVEGVMTGGYHAEYVPAFVPEDRGSREAVTVRSRPIETSW